MRLSYTVSVPESSRMTDSELSTASRHDAVTLFHHPFCPHSRFIRLALDELGMGAHLVEERPWERREAFLLLNPAGTTPVLIRDGRPPVPGAETIAEYLDETRNAESSVRRLLPGDPYARIEVRRLSQWFNAKFFNEVTEPLLTEKIYKRYMTMEQGGGAPDSQAIRAAKNNIRYHLLYVGWLVRARNWLAGEELSYADLAAAAHLSVADYLGDVPWTEDEGAKNWYARVKSRPSFRPILADALPGVPPAPTYTDLDF
jgi:glutathione S-transferase